MLFANENTRSYNNNLFEIFKGCAQKTKKKVRRQEKSGKNCDLRIDYSPAYTNDLCLFINYFDYEEEADLFFDVMLINLTKREKRYIKNLKMFNNCVE